MIGRIHVRTLKARGKCQKCGEPVLRGQPSLRYTTVKFGSAKEVGICMECARTAWPLVKGHFAAVDRVISSWSNEMYGSPEDNSRHIPPETPDEIEGMQLALHRAIYLEDPNVPQG